MKYTKDNPPLICMMDNSTCYKNTNYMEVKGILLHSTGANNPTLKRYVQPSSWDSNYNYLINKIGKNKYGNDWNNIYVNAGLNAWIGKLDDGSVSAVQTMPWDYRPWGCGSGKNGSCNNGWIQFEICEDSLNDKNYFDLVYKETCELVAYLCRLYDIGPFGFADYNGLKVPKVLCHQDSYGLGLGTNHSDIYHWFNKYNKTMYDIKLDVAKLLSEDDKEKQEQDEQEEKDDSVFIFNKGDILKVSFLEKETPDELLNKKWVVNESSEKTLNLQLIEEKEKEDFFINEIVEFIGDIHYSSAYESDGYRCKPGEAKISNICKKQGALHYYHIIRTEGSSSTVWGWVDEKDLRKINGKT